MTLLRGSVSAFALSVAETGPEDGSAGRCTAGTGSRSALLWSGRLGGRNRPRGWQRGSVYGRLARGRLERPLRRQVSGYHGSQPA